MANAAAMTSLLGSKAAVAARPAAFSGRRTSRVQVRSPAQQTCPCLLHMGRWSIVGIIVWVPC